jgi:hypothetical protein
MNVLLWIIQVALALLSLAGGAYKVFMFDQVANALWYSALPRGGWGALGVFEMVCGVLLIVPAAANWMPALTPLAAAALALESLALAGLYGRYSLELTATNPLVWVVLMGLMAAFVAYGRYALSPPASA